jgi:drug/metabolite transporter (DMT)-like permease
MGLDIRWPIGIMFSLIGVLLVITGAVNGATPQSLDINIDVIWGIVCLVFGGGMLIGAIRGRGIPPER